VARLLEDVLPVAYTQNGMTIRNHLLKTAERIEADLGEEKSVFFDGSEQKGSHRHKSLFLETA
jgi:hypothetical protein